MKLRIRRVLSFIAIAGLLSAIPARALFGDDDEQMGKTNDTEVPIEIVEPEGTDAAADENPNDLETKLLKMTTLENAFTKALRNRNQLARLILQEEAKLEEANDEEKADLRKGIGEARKRLQTLSVAMDVVFGIGKRRTYEYDPVKSMVYLQVGTVEQAFARTVRTRDILRKFVQEQQALLEAEQDEEKKAEIEGKVKAGTRQYQVVVAALQLIYGVIPQRNYQYNPQNSTLYLKISQNELENLKTQIQDLQDKRAADDGKPEEDAQDKDTKNDKKKSGKKK